MMVLICDKGLSSLWLSFSSAGHLTCQNYFKQKWKTGSASHPRCFPYTITSCVDTPPKSFPPRKQEYSFRTCGEPQTFYCVKVVLLSKQTKSSFGWAKCFPMLANMGFWDANLSSNHNRTQSPACPELTENSNPLMHYPLQKVISILYFVLRTEQWSPK